MDQLKTLSNKHKDTRMETNVDPRSPGDLAPARNNTLTNNTG